MSREIPAPFRSPDFRFILVRKADKKALEDGWQDGAAYQWDSIDLTSWLRKGGNVAIRGGDGNALVLDCDALVRLEELGILGDLPPTTRWETRPGREQRLYICRDWSAEVLQQYVGKDKDQVKFYDSVKKDEKGNYLHLGEIQGERHYGVIPPSVKKIDGQRVPYRMLDERAPAEISLEWLLEGLQVRGCRFTDRDKKHQQTEKLEQLVKESRKRRVLYDGKEAAKKRYAEKAAEDELAILRGTSEGNRNNQLNESAFSLGTLVGSGYLSRHHAERELARAARELGLDGDEIQATVESGLEAGIKEPRKIPEPEEPAHMRMCANNIAAHIKGEKVEDVTSKKVNQKVKSDTNSDDEKQSITVDAKESTATILVTLARKNSCKPVGLWHTPDGEAYITIPVNSHMEHRKLSSKAVKTWMGKLGKELLGKTPSVSAIRDALNVLEGQAIFDGPEYELFVRKAEHQGKIYVDLGDPSWRAIEISSQGWKIVENPPVRFKRAKNSLPLPMPERGGNIEDLRDLINAPTDEAWILALTWLTQAFWCRGPFAHLYLRGSQGTVKSGMMVTLKAISDPSAAKKRQIPKSQRELMITAGNESIPSFDNISTVSDAVADGLCVISTGGVSAARALWTDDEESLVRAKGAVILNGIPDLSQRGDLLDRTIILDLDPIPKEQRITEREADERLQALAPKLLGALLDITVTGLKNFGKAEIQSPPRMADFAQWVVACEPALPWKPGQFLEIYGGARDDVERDLVESNRFPLAVYRLAMDSAPGYWQGTATELLQALNQKEHVLIGSEPEDWPKSADKLGSELRRFIPALMARNVTVSYRRSDKKGSRKIILKLADTTKETDTKCQKKIDTKDTSDTSDTSFLEKREDIVNIEIEGEKSKDYNKNSTPSSSVSSVRDDAVIDSSLTPDTTGVSEELTPPIDHQKLRRLHEAVAHVLKHQPRKDKSHIGLTIADLQTETKLLPGELEAWLREREWTPESTEHGLAIWWAPEKTLRILGLLE